MKILYACNDLDYFIAHRIFVAEAMANKGWDVVVSTGGVEIATSEVEDERIEISPVHLDRHKFNFKSDMKLILHYLKLLQSERPDTVHAITIKPVLFMGLALFIRGMFGRPSVKLVWTFPGLGKVFEPDNNLKVRLRKFVVAKFISLSNYFLKPHATFENYASMNELISERVVSKENASVVMGAGLDRNQFYSTNRKGKLVVLFASRLLKAKGLGEYLEAAKILKPEFPNVDFQVAGKEEVNNPDAFSMKELMAAHNEGTIKYLGAIMPEEMGHVLRKADIHIAPSKLREGLPRVVLEAASCGCYIIASDHEMLQRFIVNGQSGWLMDKVSADAIVSPLRSALADKKSTREAGKKITEIVNKLPVYEDNLIDGFVAIYESHQR